MEITKTLYITDRKKWRKWLEKNFETEKEIWLIYPNKASDKPRILYNDAVEEALCFGWIDSTIKKPDKDSAAQRFSPRNKRSNFSQLNKERIIYLHNKGLIHPKTIPSIRFILDEEFVFPEDILFRIKQNKQAWKNFQNFSDSYKRIRISYIDSAREREVEFEKRLNFFVQNSLENKLIKGYGGTEKYY
jgi:uncharacterized protein YdeI (YjbR/CyaY-like superfamily)